MPSFANQEQLKQWLDGRGAAVGPALAVRAAMRVLPLTRAHTQADPAARAASLILPLFRAVSVGWAAVRQLDQDVVTGETAKFIRNQARLAAISVRTGAARAAAEAGKSDTLEAAAADARAGDAGDAASAMAFALHADNPTFARNFSALAVAQSVTAAARSTGGPHAAYWREIEWDAEMLESGGSATDLMARPLWRDGATEQMHASWAMLKAILLSLGGGWEIWTAWYASRLDGMDDTDTDAPAILAAESFRLAEPDWREGPQAVNAMLARGLGAAGPVKPAHMPAQIPDALPHLAVA